jgi:hypothetical protein
MPNRLFKPGFRISAFDGIILLCGCVGAFVAGSYAWWASLIICFVVGHFFLFCNVFRISRRPELIWAGTFVVLSISTLFTDIPGWIGTVAISLLLTVFLITREFRKPHYHGIFWQRINPELRNWWETSKC